MKAKRVIALIEVTRPHSALAAALATVAGAHLAQPTPSVVWFQAAAVTWLLAAAGNSFNDSLDGAVDRINRPGRPIPSGRLSAGTARMLAHLCALFALLLAIPLGALSVLGTATGILLLYGYSLWLRNVPFVGNAVVALLSGMAVVYGGIIGNQVSVVWGGAGLIFLFMFTREILKTVPDEVGDRLAGLRTVATVFGGPVAMSVCWWGVLLMGTWPALLWLVHPAFSTGVVVAGVVYYAGVGYGLWQIRQNPGRELSQRLIVTSKIWGMVMLVVVLAR
ncbi:MAG: UbiA family prenyltransferase [Chloroflexi bacterium]|nr:UbiA family prenyltransferase [Chloroflexota bacterium]